MCLDNPSAWSRFIVEEQLSSAFVNKRSILSSPHPPTPPPHPPNAVADTYQTHSHAQTRTHPTPAFSTSPNQRSKALVQGQSKNS